MTGRKSKGGGGLVKSFLAAVVFLCMNQSPVRTIWTNNIPSDLTSKTALKMVLEMIWKWRTLEEGSRKAGRLDKNGPFILI